MVARPSQAAGAAAACGSRVDIVQLVNDDLWMRDMGPIFLVNDRGDLAGLDLNFNGWGNKQVTRTTPRSRGKSSASSGSGGSWRRSCLKAARSRLTVREPRWQRRARSSTPTATPANPRARLTREILASLGARKMLGVNGLKGHDITDDHIDGLARFVNPPRSSSTSRQIRTRPTGGPTPSDGRSGTCDAARTPIPDPCTASSRESRAGSRRIRIRTRS